jgi:hypothetical protein
MSFIHLFIHEINENYSTSNREKIILYISNFKSLKKKICILKIILSFTYLLKYILYLFTLLVPLFFNFLSSFKISMIILILNILQIPIKIILDYYKINKKFFIKKQTLMRLKQEGLNFINKNGRYKKESTDDENTTIFIKKILRIIKFSVIKYSSEGKVIPSIKLKNDKYYF